MIGVVKNIFFPKNELFYDLINDMSDLLKETNGSFENYLKSSEKSNSFQFENQIKNNLKKSKTVLRQVFDQVSKNYVIPFDREDLYAITKNIYQLTEEIHFCVKKIELYKINLPSAGIEIIGLLIVEVIQHLIDLFSQLRKVKKNRQAKQIVETIIEINAELTAIEEVYYHTTDNLFNDELDLKYFIKHREILNLLMAICNKGKETLLLQESLLVKYA
jgi:uncharacterized protein Yka (UPF0111/DUF47 family)